MRGKKGMRIGEKIKKRRKEIHMTQAELASGICTQAMISRIEKKKVKPSKELMEKVAERLDVSMHYFYGGELEGSPYSRHATLTKLIRQQLKRKEYESVHYLLDTNEAVIAQSSGGDKTFFEWVKSLLYAYQDGDLDKALEHLVEMEKNVKDGDLRLEIIDSIGQIYLKKKEYQKAEVYYREGIVSFAEWMDCQKKAALLLNYVKALIEQKKYEECLDIVFKGLDLLIQKQTLAYLGDFFYYKGYCLEKLNQLTEALDAYEKAYTIFDIQQNEKFTLIIKMAQESIGKFKID